MDASALAALLAEALPQVCGGAKVDADALAEAVAARLAPGARSESFGIAAAD